MSVHSATTIEEFFDMKLHFCAGIQ